MSTLRRAGSGRGVDVDLSGLEESTVDSDDEDVSSVNTEVTELFTLAARGCLGQTSVLPPPPVRCGSYGYDDGIGVDCHEQYAKLGCNCIMEIPGKSILECKHQFARSGQILEFHIFAPPKAAPCTMPPGQMFPFTPFPPPLVIQSLWHIKNPSVVNDTVSTSYLRFSSGPTSSSSL